MRPHSVGVSVRAPFFISQQPCILEETMTESPRETPEIETTTVIAHRKSVDPTGVGLSHYILLDEQAQTDDPA